jgi:hypothetical protein
MNRSIARANNSRLIAAALTGCMLWLISPALAETGAPLGIVEPSGNPKPEYSKARDPSAAQLIETWRSANQNMSEKRVDRERFEILDRRVVQGRHPRAFLQFRILPAEGDATQWAAARCPGHDRPIEIQVFYQWSEDLNAWVAQSTRGEGNEDLCSNAPLWRPDQIETLVNPPPLPVPPRVTRAEVHTPPPGSPERVALMNALRPLYEQLFGRPIQFRVDKLRVAAGFAFVVVHPQRPNGSPIARAVWSKALGGPCFQDPSSVTHEYWMREVDGVWTIGRKNNMCADDSISGDGDLIGAPPQLIGLDAWPEREFMPEPE